MPARKLQFHYQNTPPPSINPLNSNNCCNKPVELSFFLNEKVPIDTQLTIKLFYLCISKKKTMHIYFFPCATIQNSPITTTTLTACFTCLSVSIKKLLKSVKLNNKDQSSQYSRSRDCVFNSSTLKLARETVEVNPNQELNILK